MILVLNAGSSSLKASVVEPTTAETVVRTEVRVGDDATRAEGWEQVLEGALSDLDVSGVRAVGHRVVHGGERFRAPVLVDDDVLTAIDALAELAPLHNPIAAASIRAARSRLPDLPHVACFDTAFHATLPEAAWRYPVPERWWRDWGVRRYGFHGLSVAWSVRRAAELLARPASDLRLVVAHLGSGCSVSAVDGGRSVATSMGMTPLEGLMMGTRAGSIDPGILLALVRAGRLTVDELADALDHRSGLLGVAGTADMRAIVERARLGDADARLAIELFVGRAAAGIAAAATALPALDALVFTGGIGEHATSVRDAIVKRLAVVRVPAVLTVEAREDLVIADQTSDLTE